MKEKDLERKCRYYAEKLGCKVIKIHGGPMMEAGLPDLFIFTPFGRCLLFEMKRLGKKPTTIQSRQLQEFRKRCFFAETIDNFDDFRRVIDEFLKK